jgi:hypothetical protein
VLPPYFVGCVFVRVFELVLETVERQNKKNGSKK